MKVHPSASYNRSITAGTVLDGRFELLRLLPSAEGLPVWTAEDRQDGQLVIVGFLAPSLDQTELAAISQLTHPNLAPILAMGTFAGNTYQVQPHPDAPTLQELLRIRGPLEWQDAVPLAIQVGLALQHAHSRGVLHRGLTPACISYLPSGQVIVTGFGVTSAAAIQTITLGNDQALGPVSYYAPEIVQGRQPDVRTDVYALGVILFEMLTGRVPFVGGNPVAIALHHLQDRPPRVSSLARHIPPALDRLVSHCLEKSPDLRYDSIQSLVDALDACLVDPEGVRSQPTGSSDWDSHTTALGLQRPDSNFAKLRVVLNTIQNRRWSRTRDTLIVGLILLMALGFFTIILTWTWRNFLPYFQHEPTIDFTVGTYIGQPLNDVTALLKKNDVEYIVKYVDSTVLEDQIIAQDPSAGISIIPGAAKVTLTVSGGRNLVTLDNYKGKSYATVKKALEKLGMTVVRSFEYSKTTKGNIIRTSPKAGQKVPVGTTISVVVSEGMPTVKVPDVVGLSWSDAVSLLKKNGLIVGPSICVTRDPLTNKAVTVPEKSRIIISQTLAVNVKVMPRTVIGLTYGATLDYQQSLNPTPTPSPTPKATPTPRQTATPTPTGRVNPTPTTRPTRFGG